MGLDANASSCRLAVVGPSGKRLLNGTGAAGDSDLEHVLGQLDAFGLAEHLRVGAMLQEKITALDPSLQRLEELQPLCEMLVPLNAQIEAADHRISALEKTDPAVALLMTAPGIGAITASAVVAVADDITRFDSAHQFEAFLGLVPGELSSGDKRHIGHITKAGNVRYLLVEAAWRLNRSSRTTRPHCPHGPSESPIAAASASRSSRSLAGLPEFSTRCGVTTGRSMRRALACRAHAPLH
jgi:hypothetical protein